MKKKTIAASILSIALCGSLATGATFALFTSEDNVNIAINAGKVEVVAKIEGLKTYSMDTEQANNAFANGGAAVLNGNELALNLMTPGDKAEFNIVLTNNSNVAVQYQTAIMPGEDNGLFDGLVITIDGEQFNGVGALSDWTFLDPNEATNRSIPVIVELPKEVGNDYQGTSTALAISVSAVQGNAMVAVPVVYDGGEATLDLDTNGPITANGYDGAILAKNNANLTIQGNATVKALESNGGEGDEYYAMAVWATDGATVTIKDGYYTNSNAISNDDHMDLIYASKGGKIVIEGGSFKSAVPAWTLNIKDADRATSGITVTGGRFYQFDPSNCKTEGENTNFVAYGYEVVQDGEWYEVVLPDLFIDDDKQTMQINSAEGLVEFANIVNGTTKAKAAPNTLEGWTVTLMNDIDMKGVEYTPAGNVISYPSITFAGTFDGQGYTIDNLVANAEGDGGFASAGLFGSITGVVENVILDNATITSTHYAGGIVGYSSSNVGMAIRNCKVLNSTITSTPELLADGSYDNGDKVGGIIGYCVAGDVVEGNYVANTKVTGYRDIGGIVGHAAGTIKDNEVKDITLIIDKLHNYKNYTTDKEHDCNPIIGEFTENTVQSNNIVNGEVDIPQTAVVATAEKLKEILTNFTDAGAGNSIVTITSDIELSEAWSPVTVQGYTGAGVITINGNGHTISGLTAPLFKGGFAGASGIVINDLTIADSKIVSTNTLGSGAFIETIDSMPTITLNNCHLLNSTVKGSRTGGLIGWTAGYNNENNGPVKTYVTIKDCSVVGCTIENTFSDEGNTPHTESVGAICGHAGNNAWTYTTIENCVVKNNTIIGGNGKTGVILGTANVGEVTISGCTMEGNTVNGVESDAVYGRFVPGTTGKLTIDGKEIK